MPFFSIIVPTYNRAKATRKLIESLSNQTFKDFEVIIVDDGSTDGTKEELASLMSEHIRYFFIENHERAFARNYGLQQATGFYINYFDSDDRFYNDRLEVICSFIQSHNFPDVLYSHYNFEDEKGRITGATQRHYSDFSEDILFNNFLATDSVFLKREVAMDNLFHERRELITAEDWEVWLRVSTRNIFVECAAKTFAIVQHPNRSLERISPERIEIRDAYFARLVKSNEDLKRTYGSSRINLFVADRYTFVALSFAIARQRMNAIRYLLKSAHSSLRVVSRRRFLAVIKNLL